MPEHTILPLSDGPRPDPAAVSRRRFLQLMGVLAGGALGACAGAEQRTLFEAGSRGTSTPVVVFPSPPAAEAQATPAPELAQFLALSVALTGVPNLDLRLAQVYWDSLTASGQQAALTGLLERAGLAGGGEAPALEALQSAGLFDDPEARRLAGEITKLWYTGVYTQGEEPAVATFTDALAWKMLRFTKPATVCGSFGFWAIRPLVDVSRSAGPVAPAVATGGA
jgi:hypothetical protein